MALAAVMACSLSFPSLAFAKVSVDEAELAQGENSVGGGKATLTDSTLDMVDVTAGVVRTDEDLTMNFNGGNDVGAVVAEGDSNVKMNFDGKNQIEDVWAAENSDVTVNADDNAEIEEVHALDDANVTVNVTGQNDIEEIEVFDNANVTVSGTDCQKKDVVNIGNDEDDAGITAENGSVTIKNVTVNLKCKKATVGSKGGNVVIDTAKIAKGDDNEYALVEAGGTMQISESVIDIAGTVKSTGKMTIKHSDLKVKAPSAKYADGSQKRIWSAAGIELSGMANGEVKDFEANSQKAFYVSAGDGKDVDLKADGDPAYYNCSGEKKGSVRAAALSKTGDPNNPLFPLPIALASVAAMGVAVRRMQVEPDASEVGEEAFPPPAEW